MTHKCFDFSFELLKFSISQPLWQFFASQGSLQQHATLGDRVDYLEKLMGDSADKHHSCAMKRIRNLRCAVALCLDDLDAPEPPQAHTKLDQLRGRLTALEAESLPSLVRVVPCLLIM